MVTGMRTRHSHRSTGFESPESPIVVRGRALLASVGVRDAPAVLAALAHELYVSVQGAELPEVELADELAWLHDFEHPPSEAIRLTPAWALALCEATPQLAARLPQDPETRADAALFELREVFDAIVRPLLFERFPA
jgi:hypothetical protein